ncbi:response regulator transcription factor [Leucobacter weissii]|uniref:Response regulator transcription factor n=1 Tax=Leucobacter weissii TaxID=1983706 RepID=A0A939MML5_9MICO|nr:response regulator transcription factor [Leucobacter weissii]MBO1901236.1 response regulator transcription factor [Leucobacter weissii]
MIRVLLVDDQALVRSGFRVILDSEADIEVVGEAADGAEAVRLAASLSPQVICMDVEMPALDGIEASRRILASAGDGSTDRAGAPAILILTTFGHESYLFDALAAGVSGFLLKTSRAEHLIDAVRTLASGGALLGPDVTRAVMERAAEQSPRAPQEGAAVAPDPPQLGLTEREREVLGLVATGRSNAEIADELFLGSATVKTHVSNLLQKLGARDRVQLVVWAHTRGFAGGYQPDGRST